MADRIRKTPPLGTRGRYSAIAPFDVMVSDVLIYECVALRQFEDFIDLGLDVFTEFYAVVGIENGDYLQDKNAGAAILTLMDPYGSVIYVPDTYIASFPNMGQINYQRVIVTADLGPLPDYLDLSFLQSQVQGIVSDIIGTSGNRGPVVKLAIAPTREAIDPTEHEILEASRVAAITMRQTDRAKALAAAEEIAALQERIVLLEEVIRNAGLSN